MRERIIAMLNKINPGLVIKEEIDFIDDAEIDSMEIMDIVIGLEEEFVFEIAPTDIIPDYFRNIDTLLELVNKTLKNGKDGDDV